MDLMIQLERRCAMTKQKESSMHIGNYLANCRCACLQQNQDPQADYRIQFVDPVFESRPGNCHVSHMDDGTELLLQLVCFP